jgi:hypothetical protein
MSVRQFAKDLKAAFAASWQVRGGVLILRTLGVGGCFVSVLASVMVRWDAIVSVAGRGGGSLLVLAFSVPHAGVIGFLSLGLGAGGLRWCRVWG